MIKTKILKTALEPKANRASAITHDVCKRLQVEEMGLVTGGRVYGWAILGKNNYGWKLNGLPKL